MLGTERRKRLAIIVLGTVTGVSLAVALFGYLANRAPGFYHQIEGLSPDGRLTAARQFIRGSTEIWNQIENQPVWTGKFSDTQVNAWLAGDFAQKHTGMLPRGVSEPRVAFENARVALAFQLKCGPVKTLISATGQIWLAEPSRIAIELDRVRAGVIPIPLGLVVRKLSSVARSAGMDLEWRQHAGNPVALVRLIGSDHSSGIAIDRIDLQPGRLYVAGRSRYPGGPGHRPADSSESGSAGVSLRFQLPDSPFTR